MIKAYVLIAAHPDQTKQVHAALEAVRGLVACDEVSGPYDIVATVNVASLNEMSRNIRAISGVLRTTTLVAFPE